MYASLGEKKGKGECIDPSDLAEKTGISTEQARDLIKAFKAGSPKDAPVTLKQFKEVIAEVHKLHPDNNNFSPELAEVLFDIFDADSNGTVDVIEFIAGVNTMAYGTLAEKAELVFNGIDYDNNGKISKKELTTYVSKALSIAKALVNKNVKEEGLGVAVRLAVKVAMKKVQNSVVEDIVKQAFAVDTDRDSKLDIEEWNAAIKSGNEAILIFLNPREQAVQTMESLKEALEEVGAVTNQEDLQAWKKRALS